MSTRSVTPSTSTPVSGSEEDTVYEYACQLLQGTCESDWSVPVTFQTLPACPSPAEAEVVMLSLTHDRATFDCTKPADQYQWRWRLPAGSWTSSARSSNSAFDVSGLSENTSYRIECRLLCNGDESWWSLTESFQTLPAPTLPPPRLTDVICNHNNRTLRVAWTSTPGESFKIQVSMNGTTWMDEQPSWPAAGVGNEASYLYSPPPGTDLALLRVERNQGMIEK